MNALEVYRRLPRTNCGLCTQTRCMPFAVALSAGDADASACPGLADDDRRSLSAVVGSGDWRETLIADLRREVAALTLPDLAEGLGARIERDALAVRCLGRDFHVGPDGAITAEGSISPWMRILLLHYVRTAGNAPLAGRWVAFSALRGGMVKAVSFARECEEPLRELFDRDPEGTERALERLGGTREPGQSAPKAWRVEALPKVPALLLYWPEEEEFPSKASVLLDATADRFLDVETLIFLFEGLARTLESGPERAVHD